MDNNQFILPADLKKENFSFPVEYGKYVNHLSQAEGDMVIALVEHLKSSKDNAGYSSVRTEIALKKTLKKPYDALVSEIEEGVNKEFSLEPPADANEMAQKVFARINPESNEIQRKKVINDHIQASVDAIVFEVGRYLSDAGMDIPSMLRRTFKGMDQQDLGR